MRYQPDVHGFEFWQYAGSAFFVRGHSLHLGLDVDFSVELAWSSSRTGYTGTSNQASTGTLFMYTCLALYYSSTSTGFDLPRMYKTSSQGF